MSRFTCFTLAVLALSATAASAQIYPLTNGRNDTGPNVVDSAKGFDGINAVAPERELLYHPERAGPAAGGATPFATGAFSPDEAAPIHRRARHHRRQALSR